MKQPNWQRKRVNLIQQLLEENRLCLSAQCHECRRMFKGLRINTRAGLKTYLAPGQEEKHAFDAVSYAIAMYLLGELSMPPPQPVIQRRMIAV